MDAGIGPSMYRIAVGVALIGVLLLIWLSLGVGIIGRDGDPANMMYFGVVALGAVGAVISRFRPLGMARSLFAMAFAQAFIAVVAVVQKLGLPWSGPAEILILNGFFVVLFIGSGILFLRAANDAIFESR